MDVDEEDDAVPKKGRMTVTQKRTVPKKEGHDGTEKSKDDGTERRKEDDAERLLKKSGLQRVVHEVRTIWFACQDHYIFPQDFDNVGGEPLLPEFLKSFKERVWEPFVGGGFGLPGGFRPPRRVSAG